MNDVTFERRSGLGEHWCVVGGGALGLTLALRLAQAGRKVTVLEASDRLGGLADAWSIETRDGRTVTWDRHYHVALLSDFNLRGLLAELGLEHTIQWTTTQADFYTDRTFYPLNSSIDYLRFPPLGPVDKARLAATILYAARIEDGRRLESIPLADWLVKMSGRRTYERIWRPLLRAKLGANHAHASAAFIWAVIRRLYAARRSGLKTELFGYIEGGYERMLTRFAAILTEHGVALRTSSPVQQIRAAGGGFAVATGGASETYDKVVVTASGPLAARMCPDLTEAEKTAHRGLTYQGIVCPSVVLRRPLRNAYMTYIADPEIPFTAVIEMTALVPPQKLSGCSLTYLPCYVPTDDPLFETPDAEIEARFLAALQRMYPDLTGDDILAFRISRARHVVAVPTLNYSEKRPPMETSLPGLFVVNSAHISNGALSVDLSVELGNRALKTLIGQDVAPVQSPAAPMGSAAQ